MKGGTMEDYVLGYFILVGVCLGFFIFFLIFIRNKKKDNGMLNIEFSYEEGSKSYLKDNDKKYVLLNLDRFKEIIGNGKNFYIQAFLSKKNKFNGGAFLGGILWLGYRGLILEYFTFLGICLFIDILTLYLNITIPQNVFGIGVTVTIGMLANYLYFLKIKNKIENNKKLINPFLGVAIVVISSIIYGYFIEYLAFIFN
jgi:hypothetical protein